MTPYAFKKYPMRAFAEADQGGTGRVDPLDRLFRNKATNIRACCKAIVEVMAARCRSMEELVPLPGVDARRRM